MGEMRTKVWLGDVELSEHFKIVDVERPYPMRSATVERAAGRNGGVLTSSSYEPIEITMRLACTGDTREERRELIRWLVSLLDFDEPRQLQFSDDYDRYYMVVPTGGGNRKATFRSDSVDVTFTALDPVMYGRTGGTTASNQMLTEGWVDGTAKTYPIVTTFGYSYADSNNQWEITMDGERSMTFTFPDQNGHAVEIDCEKGVATLDGSTSIVPGLDSDWLDLEPGDHTFQLTKGTASNPIMIEWVTRWL